MKIINKTLAVLIAVVIMLGTAPIIMPPATAVQTFGDIGGHWAQADIRRLNELGSLEDFSSGNFRPNDPITRAEFFSLVVRTLGATVRGDISRFTDMNQDDWYYDTVAIAVNMGIANGYDDNTMRPNNSLTRQDAATIAARALGMSSKNELIISRFTDNSTVSSYARTYVAAFAEKGLITGYPDGTLCPLKSITRAEAVKIISNIFPNIHMPESTLHNVSLRGGVLVTSPFAELRDVVLYGDVIVGDGVGSGSVLLSNCTIYGCLIVRG
ncbi:MAG: S-layer homology domain-containing protein, partial [Oscillospiraceae bacterium]|nr:S-layer homology domain-containing protein [Oscillospiraceae bacterium]